MAGVQRCDQAEDFAPVLPDHLGPDLLAHQGRQVRIGGRRRDRDQPAIGEVPQPWAEPEPQQGAEREHMVRRPARISVVLGEHQTGGVVEQAVQDVGRFVGRRRDHPKW